ncbi:extracellular solute-binding protein [Paenibacillus periandrae]|uniref:extracellular solute-binding protein n=1 Tax=Paenibacillus periandrae TaxID=1761741 RepID=UPI001F08E0CC|nr:extracellular solute-binding protein [Paenibacillus periandrae]
MSEKHTTREHATVKGEMSVIMKTGFQKMNMQKTGVQKTTAAVLSTLCLAGALTACSPTADNKTTDAAKAGTAPAATEPLKLSVLVNFIGEAPQPGNEVVKAIEKYTNSEIEVQWLTDIKEKLPVMVASGSLPKIVSVTNSQMKLPYMVSALRGDTFWNLTTYIKSYPNLSQINPLIYQNTSLDGQVYGLPAVRPVSRAAITYRADWFKKLGLKEPRTLDEFYDVLKAIATKDPDGDGKDNTYGFIEYKSLGIVDRTAIWLGAPNEWGVQNGKLVYAPTTDAYLQSLQFVKKLYDEKLINRDFAVMEKSAWESAFAEGKAGMLSNITDTAFKLEEQMKKSNPQVELGMFNRLPDLKGGPTKAENGSNGIFSFPKSSVKSEAELKRILTFFDKLAEPEMATLFKWGLEGKHYKQDNGKPVYIDAKIYNKEVLPYQKLMAVEAGKALQGNDPALVVKGEQLNKDNEKYAVPNAAEALISDTYSEKGGQLDKLIEDAKTKFVMGKIDEEGWKQALEQWRKNGGDKVAAEFTSAYEKVNKK